MLVEDVFPHELLSTATVALLPPALEQEAAVRPVLVGQQPQSVISCRWPMASPGRFEVPGHFQTGRDSTAPKMAEPAHGNHGEGLSEV